MLGKFVTWIGGRGVFLATWEVGGSPGVALASKRVGRWALVRAGYLFARACDTSPRELLGETFVVRRFEM